MKGTIVNSFSVFSTYLLPMNQSGLMEKTTTFSYISLQNAANNDNLVCVTVIVTLLILRWLFAWLSGVTVFGIS